MPLVKDFFVEEKFVSDPGDRYRPIYTPEIQSDGTIELVQTGVEDLQEIYNSQRETCDVNVLVQKFMSGDETALSRGNPVFLDLLGAPKSLMEAYQIQFRAQQAFERLPAEIRDQFGSDFGKFIAEAGSASWFEKLKMPEKMNDVKEVDSSES